MHFIHFNVSILLSKIDEIHCIAKTENATVIGLSEIKTLNGELEEKISDYTSFCRFFSCNSISFNCKPNFCGNAGSLFIRIFLNIYKPCCT